MHFDVMSVRLDRLTGHLASSAVGLGPDMIDAVITDVLRQVCELLGVDFATLESMSEDTLSPGRRRAWIRHHAASHLEPALTIGVAVQSGCDFALSIGPDTGRSPWPDAVVDGLRALANVMVLIVLRTEQMQELERIKFSSRPRGDMRQLGHSARAGTWMISKASSETARPCASRSRGSRRWRRPTPP